MTFQFTYQHVPGAQMPHVFQLNNASTHMVQADFDAILVWLDQHKAPNKPNNVILAESQTTFTSPDWVSMTWVKSPVTVTHVLTVQLSDNNDMVNFRLTWC